MERDSAVREASSLQSEVQTLRTETLSLRDQVTTGIYAQADKSSLEKDRTKMQAIITRYKEVCAIMDQNTFSMSRSNNQVFRILNIRVLKLIRFTSTFRRHNAI